MEYTREYIEYGRSYDRHQEGKRHAAFKDVRAEEKLTELPCHELRRCLAFLGVLPCLFNPPYMPSLSITKSSIVYSVVLYSIMSCDVIWSVMHEKRLYDETDPSNLKRSQHLEHILGMLPHLLGFHFWFDVPALSSILEQYMDLQMKFQTATGKQLLNRTKFRERKSIMSAVGVLCILFLILHVLSPASFRVNLPTAFAVMYGSMLAIGATYLWTGLSWAVNDAAEQTKTEFRRQLDILTPSKVYDYRLVWLSMRTTLDSLGRLQTPTLVYSCSMCAVVILFYEGAVLMQFGEIVPAVGHLISGAFYIGLVTQVCTSSHCVEQEAVLAFPRYFPPFLHIDVKVDVKWITRFVHLCSRIFGGNACVMKCLVGEVLPKISLTAYDIKIQREIVMLFLIENARPGLSIFRGFTVINKNLILSFFSNISTYIIVLVQFRQSGESWA